MTKKRKIIGIIALLVLLLGIGGKIYMNIEKKKDLEELRVIQKDLANYIYNNYRFCTADKEKQAFLHEEYQGGKGSITTEEYIEKAKYIYIDMKISQK